MLYSINLQKPHFLTVSFSMAVILIEIAAQKTAQRIHDVAAAC